jgi:hypothetical protein
MEIKVESIDPIVRSLRYAEEIIKKGPHSTWKDVSNNQLDGIVKGEENDQ